MPKSSPSLREEVAARADELLLRADMPTYSDLTIAFRQILSELQLAREHSITPTIPAVQKSCERIAKNMLRRIHAL